MPDSRYWGTFFRFVFQMTVLNAMPQADFIIQKHILNSLYTPYIR